MSICASGRGFTVGQLKMNTGQLEFNTKFWQPVKGNYSLNLENNLMLTLFTFFRSLKSFGKIQFICSTMQPHTKKVNFEPWQGWGQGVWLGVMKCCEAAPALKKFTQRGWGVGVSLYMTNLWISADKQKKKVIYSKSYAPPPPPPPTWLLCPGIGLVMRSD